VKRRRDPFARRHEREPPPLAAGRDYTTGEVALLLDKSTATIRKWREGAYRKAHGDVGPRWYRNGGSPMYRGEDIIRWRERNLVPVAP
jgi:hypothetical protein